MNFFQIVNKLMTDILLSDEFVYTVNNYDYIVTVWLTRSGIVELKKNWPQCCYSKRYQLIKIQLR